ncbi:MAG: hypothetical protein Kow0059_20990 [Candidatus Sumerlaeia bacterium]
MADTQRKIAVFFTNRADRRLLSEHLCAQGYEVLPPSARPEPGADLFVLDSLSVQRLGRAVLDIKSSDRAFLPVLVALKASDRPERFLTAGFDHCLRLPVSMLELDTAVKVFLRLREQSQLMLAQAENIYQTIFETTGTATLILEEDGTIAMANKECFRVAGYAPEDLIGMKWSAFAAPDSLEKMLAYHKARRTDPSSAPRRYEAHLINKNGDVLKALLDVSMIPGTGRSVVSIVDITEQRRAEEALRESELRNRLVAEMISDYAYIFRVNEQGELKGEWVTESFTKVFGLTLPEVDALGGWKSLVHPEDLDKALQHARRVAAGRADVCEMRWLTSSGEVRWLRDYARPVFDPAGNRVVRVYGASQDITEQKNAEEALRKSNEELTRLSQQFHTLLDAIPDTLALLDKDLNILWVNRALAARFGSAQEALAGKRCCELMHNIEAPYPNCPVLASFASGEPSSATITNPDGRIWEFRSVPVKEGDRVWAAIEVGRDVTELHRLQAQYLQAQKMQVVGQLAGGVAHDFNNILTTILGFAELALTKLEPNSPVQPDIESVLEAAERAAHLTKELLLFSRKHATDRSPVDLNEIVERCAKFMRRVIGEHITLELKLSPQPLPMLADRYQIEQVLLNLATNARDAMPKGGTLSVCTRPAGIEETTIVPGGDRPERYAMLTFSDTGIGMDEETLKHIFEPFFTTKEVGKGSGLGMSVVYGIIQHHDGFIDVSSEPGKGTTFKIYLPLSADGARRETTAPSAEVLPGGTETVLVAEDDAALRKFTATVLARHGYTVIEAADGEEAVRKFAENSDSVRLLLFDLIMPKMNGKEAFVRIRKTRPDIRAVFLSGYAPEEVQQQIKLENAARLISKPVSPATLLKEVRNALDGK